MATFVFKVFTLAVKTASKPLANRFQNYVLAHPTLRPQVLKFAQGIHALDFAMTRLAEGKPIGTSKKFVAALDDDRAMELAGKFVSEGFVLAVGVGILAWDYNRSSRKDEAKKAKDEAYRASVNQRFEAFQEGLNEQRGQNAEMLAAVQAGQNRLQHQVSILMEQERRRQQGSWSLWGKRESAVQ